jgi:hypothetical protein
MTNQRKAEFYHAANIEAARIICGGSGEVSRRHAGVGGDDIESAC